MPWEPRTSVQDPEGFLETTDIFTPSDHESDGRHVLVMLTVPHSACPPGSSDRLPDGRFRDPVRRCDRIAHPVAEDLMNHIHDMVSEDILERLRMHVTLVTLDALWEPYRGSLVCSEKTCALLDLNRDSASERALNTRFRQRIREIVRRQRSVTGAEFVLLDIHSFPPGSFGTTQSDIVLLKNLSLRDLGLTGSLADLLRRQGFTGGMLQGSEENSIIIEASRELGARVSVLLEYCEALTVDGGGNSLTRPQYGFRAVNQSVAWWLWNTVIGISQNT